VIFNVYFIVSLRSSRRLRCFFLITRRRLIFMSLTDTTSFNHVHKLFYLSRMHVTHVQWTLTSSCFCALYFRHRHSYVVISCCMRRLERLAFLQLTVVVLVVIDISCNFLDFDFSMIQCKLHHVCSFMLSIIYHFLDSRIFEQ
jgi:hypothetical protein